MTLRRTRRQPPTITDVPTPVDPSVEPIDAGVPPASPESLNDPADPLDALPLSATVPAESIAPPDVHVSIRQRRFNPAINWTVLAIVILLLIAGIAGSLIARGLLPNAISNGWPLLAVLIGGIWFLRAFGRKSGAGVLGSSTLLGLSLSLILATTGGIPFGQTWVGLTAIIIGIGVLLRGLLWRTSTV